MEPITRDETFLAAAGGQSVELPEPLTREEAFLAKAAGEDVETPEPITRRESFLEKIAEGGGSSVTVEELDVTENGTYTAPSGTAYSPVVVNVPGGAISHVDTVDGTLEAPFGALDTDDLVDAIRAGEALATLSFTAGGEEWTLNGEVAMDETWDEEMLRFAYTTFPIVSYEGTGYARVSYFLAEGEPPEMALDSCYKPTAAAGSTVLDGDQSCTLTVTWLDMSGQTETYESEAFYIYGAGQTGENTFSQAVEDFFDTYCTGTTANSYHITMTDANGETGATTYRVMGICTVSSAVRLYVQNMSATKANIPYVTINMTDKIVSGSVNGGRWVKLTATPVQGA